MSKKENKDSSPLKKTLPSMIELVAKTLRDQVKTKEAKPTKGSKTQANMSNTIEQIAALLRKTTAKSKKMKRGKGKAQIAKKTTARRRTKRSNKKKIC